MWWPKHEHPFKSIDHITCRGLTLKELEGKIPGFICIDESSRLTSKMLSTLIRKQYPMKSCIFRSIVIFGQNFIADCPATRDGEEITFKHDKNNVHDHFAVLAINKQGKPVGWVPKEISPTFVQYLKAGYTLVASVSKQPTRMWNMKHHMNFSCDVFAIKKGKKK
jgi:hypothetical protein